MEKDNNFEDAIKDNSQRKAPNKNNNKIIEDVKHEEETVEINDSDTELKNEKNIEDDIEIDEELLKEEEKHHFHPQVSFFIEFEKKKKIVIISILAILGIFLFNPFSFFNNNENLKNKTDVEVETISKAIDAIHTMDASKIAPYFESFDEEWLTELDFTSNLASSEDLKEATNLAELNNIKKELLKTVLLNNVKKIEGTENNNVSDEDKEIESKFVSVTNKAVKLEEVTKNIVASLLGVSIELSKNDVSVDEMVNSYVESFKTVTKTEYTTTTENMTVEMVLKDGENPTWIIKDFRKFINTMIPEGNFYEDYMKSLNGDSVKEKKTDNSKTVIETVEEAQKKK